MVNHTCPLHLAGDRLCYKGCGCRCEDCTEMHHWRYRGPKPAAPDLYLQDLSDGNCAGFPQFTEMPDAAQYRACITCPVFAICPQPTPWPRGECCREGHDVEHRHPTLRHCTECERERGRRKKLIARSRASERGA